MNWCNCPSLRHLEIRARLAKVGEPRFPLGGSAASGSQLPALHGLCQPLYQGSRGSSMSTVLPTLVVLGYLSWFRLYLVSSSQKPVRSAVASDIVAGLIYAAQAPFRPRIHCLFPLCSPFYFLNTRSHVCRGTSTTSSSDSRSGFSDVRRGRQARRLLQKWHKPSKMFTLFAPFCPILREGYTIPISNIGCRQNPHGHVPT